MDKIQLYLFSLIGADQLISLLLLSEQESLSADVWTLISQSIHDIRIHIPISAIKGSIHMTQYSILNLM